MPEVTPSSGSKYPYREAAKEDIKREPENIEKYIEKNVREEKKDVDEYIRKSGIPRVDTTEMDLKNPEILKYIESYCKEYDIPISQYMVLLQHSKERLKLGQYRTEADRKELKDHRIIYNPENVQTIALAQDLIKGTRPSEEERPSLAGRAKLGAEDTVKSKRPM